MVPDFILVYTPHKNVEVKILQPDLSEIPLEVIARALSRECRWSGLGQYWFDVAAHSVLVTMIIEALCIGDASFAMAAKGFCRLMMAGLLHDGHEAMPPQDVATPAQFEFTNLSLIQKRYDDALACGPFKEAIELMGPLNDVQKFIVKYADRIASFLEANCMYGVDNHSIGEPLPHYVRSKDADRIRAFVNAHMREDVGVRRKDVPSSDDVFVGYFKQALIDLRALKRHEDIDALEASIKEKPMTLDEFESRTPRKDSLYFAALADEQLQWFKDLSKRYDPKALVVGLHCSKSTVLPVVSFALANGVSVVVRSNFINIAVSVAAPFGISYMMVAEIVERGDSTMLNECYFEGFSKKSVFSKFGQDQQKFSVHLDKKTDFAELLVRLASIPVR